MKKNNLSMTKSDILGERKIKFQLENIYGLYNFNDFSFFQSIFSPLANPSVTLSTVDDLLARDKEREKDGYKPKIKIGKLMKPGQGGKGDSVILVPTTVEEKLYHGRPSSNEENTSGGQGDGEEGEIIKESSPDGNDSQGEGDGDTPGQGGDGDHEITQRAYEVGKILTEKFELPRIQEKNKKMAVNKVTYELTDRNRGSGQLLNKSETIKEVVKTNLALGKIKRGEVINPSNLLVGPNDKIYHILSSEQEYESQAVVFFVRDYSGSMNGTPSEVICSQHLMIYSWLMYQYNEMVIPRFILHDTEAKEVPDFYTYYNSQAAGGTKVSPAYNLVNTIVRNENLMRDYNIYIFHGTDGDDWDNGNETLGELFEIVEYVNRIGITVARNDWSNSNNSTVEEYITQSGFLEDYSDQVRLDAFNAKDVNEDRIVESIKKIIL